MGGIIMISMWAFVIWYGFHTGFSDGKDK